MKAKKLLIALGALALAGCGVSPLEQCAFNEELTDYLCEQAPTGEEVTIEASTGVEP